MYKDINDSGSHASSKNTVQTFRLSFVKEMYHFNQKGCIKLLESDSKDFYFTLDHYPKNFES